VPWVHDMHITRAGVIGWLVDAYVARRASHSPDAAGGIDVAAIRTIGFRERPLEDLGFVPCTANKPGCR
jgi:hypothetical protein